MDFKQIFDFLIEIKFNNNRNWFKENNESYQNAKSNFEEFINLLLPKIKEIDKSIEVNSAKECTYRIFKDVRFSNNKEPYKTNFGAVIAKGGKKSQNAGFYIHFEPDSSFIGGGLYMPQPAILKSIRTEIFENPDKFKNILNNPEFKKYFPEIFGDKLKTAPKGFPRDFKDIELLRHKHFVVSHAIDNSFWFEDNVIDKIIEIFKIENTLNQYLNQIIS